GFTVGTFLEPYRKLAANGVLDESGFVARALRVPGVNAEHGKVAGLAFGAACAGDKVLRLVSIGTGDAIEFEPADGADICGGQAFANGIRQVQLDKASDNPPSDGYGLVAGLRGGIGFGGAPNFSRRARGDGANEVPIFFLGA